MASETAITGAWLSYYYLLKQDIERLDHRLVKMSQEAITLGASEELCAAFIATNLPELMQHVTRQRELRENRKGEDDEM